MFKLVKYTNEERKIRRGRIIEDEDLVKVVLPPTAIFPPEPISQVYSVEATPEPPVEVAAEPPPGPGYGDLEPFLASVTKFKKKGKKARKSSYAEPPPPVLESPVLDLPISDPPVLLSPV